MWHSPTNVNCLKIYEYGTDITMTIDVWEHIHQERQSPFQDRRPAKTDTENIPTTKKIKLTRQKSISWVQFGIFPLLFSLIFFSFSLFFNQYQYFFHLSVHNETNSPLRPTPRGVSWRPRRPSRTSMAMTSLSLLHTLFLLPLLLPYRDFLYHFHFFIHFFIHLFIHFSIILSLTFTKFNNPEHITFNEDKL